MPLIELLLRLALRAQFVPRKILLEYTGNAGMQVIADALAGRVITTGSVKNAFSRFRKALTDGGADGERILPYGDDEGYVIDLSLIVVTVLHIRDPFAGDEGR